MTIHVLSGLSSGGEVEHTLKRHVRQLWQPSPRAEAGSQLKANLVYTVVKTFSEPAVVEADL